MARELVRRIQSLRKDSGFRIEDHIVTYCQAEGDSAAVFERFGDYIRQETLTDELRAGAGPDSAAVVDFDLDGLAVRLALVRA